MTAFIIILIIVFILSLLIVPFAKEMVRDREELSTITLDKKFEVLLGIINKGIMEDTGKLYMFPDDRRSMNMYSDEHRNILIQFMYSTGNLTITLNYKWLHKELVFNKQFSGLRNVSIFGQKDIANEFVELCRIKMAEHQRKVGHGDVSHMTGAPAIETDADPTSMISGMYDNFSDEQKMSIVNFLYMIGKANGSNDEKIISSVGFSQTILPLNKTFDACKHQLDVYGEDKIYTDLYGLDSGVTTILLMSALQMMQDLSNVPGVIEPVQELTMLSMFNKIGYTESQLNDLLEKMRLMSEMFGMG